MADIPHIDTIEGAIKVLKRMNCIWAINYALGEDWDMLTSDDQKAIRGISKEESCQKS